MKLIFSIDFQFQVRKVSSLREVFANNLTADTKFSKAKFSKIIQAGGFLGRRFGSLMKVGLPLMKYVLKSLAKSVLIT